MLKTVNMNMTRIQLLYILLISILIAFSGCQSQTDDDSSTTDPQSIVYLSVTRAQVDGLETFNADDEDYEDRVHDMAMLVFDSSTGTKVGEYFDEHIALSEKDKSFVIQLTPGKRDFYFVANMPVNELKKITTQSDMDVYMNTFSDLDPDLYLSASEDKGFPMSRVYRNQIITEGGSLYSPQPFRPDNVEVGEDGNVTISNTIEACDPHKVTLETVGDFKFSDGTTTKTFTDADPQSSVQYVLSPVPTSGTYMKVYYNGNLVKTFSK